MTLTERLRLCRTCGRHEAIQDGRDCADCTNDMLRVTRPAAIRTPVWLQRARQRPTGLARDLTGSESL